ncbi:FAD-binding domain-containing protein [Suillus decipiens]|nr:FAD-binding domain-containing protein [Suillus decipiens]
MTFFPTLSLAVISGLIGLSVSTGLRRADYTTTCQAIAANVSSASKVYYSGTEYNDDNNNWALTNTETSACSFEPANAQDVGIALQILGENQTPFAVKGGGHSANPGFSSTPGVQIAMTQFSEVVYDESAQTATIGMGLVWEDIYSSLANYDMVVVGGKDTDVGVAGVVLGGGYSCLSNQYGLAVDNVVSFELVMPNGTVANITSSSNPDLFYGLRGGFNNFGIATTVTLNTFPQSQVWGGMITFPQDQWGAFNNATANFVSNVTDPKACLFSTTDYVVGAPVMATLLFYNAPTPPDGIFDEFLAIPSSVQDISTRTYLSILSLLPPIQDLRFAWYWVPLETFTVPILEMIENQTLSYGAEVWDLSGAFVSYDIIPLLPSIYDHSEAPSAFPSVRDSTQGNSFVEILYGWTDASNDDAIIQLGADSAAYMNQFLSGVGQDFSSALLYPNCVPPDTSLEAMYGDALGTLQSIKGAVDPNNVMGLAGGWKF